MQLNFKNSRFMERHLWPYWNFQKDYFPFHDSRELATNVGLNFSHINLVFITHLSEMAGERFFWFYGFLKFYWFVNHLQAKMKQNISIINENKVIPRKKTLKLVKSWKAKKSVAALYAKKKERGRVILLPPLVSDYEIKLRQWD